MYFKVIMENTSKLFSEPLTISKFDASSILNDTCVIE